VIGPLKISTTSWKNHELPKAKLHCLDQRANADEKRICVNRTAEHNAAVVVDCCKTWSGFCTHQRYLLRTAGTLTHNNSGEAKPMLLS
jgi:hypothetical protein